MGRGGPSPCTQKASAWDSLWDAGTKFAKMVGACTNSCMHRKAACADCVRSFSSPTMLLLARTGLFALTTGARASARRAAVMRMASTATTSPRGNLGSASEAEAAYTLDGGYALEPADDLTGGWLAHRSSLDVPGSGPGDDWVRRVFDDPEGGLEGGGLLSGRADPPAACAGAVRLAARQLLL